MPQMDGFETTKSIIDLCGKAGVKVPYMVALTANSDDSIIRKRCQDHGLMHFVQKPIMKNQLVDIFMK